MGIAINEFQHAALRTRLVDRVYRLLTDSTSGLHEPMAVADLSNQAPEGQADDPSEDEPPPTKPRAEKTAAAAGQAAAKGKKAVKGKAVKGKAAPKAREGEEAEEEGGGGGGGGGRSPEAEKG